MARRDDGSESGSESSSGSSGSDSEERGRRRKRAHRSRSGEDERRVASGGEREMERVHRRGRDDGDERHGGRGQQPRGRGGDAEEPARELVEALAPAPAPAPAPARPSRLGGTYVPPFKLAQMMKEVEDKTGAEYQRLTWDALKKSINGLVNKVNAANIKDILPEIFSENLVRGRGLFARSVMKSQMSSPQFSPVFAALVAVINTKLPELGELVLKRVVLQFRRSYKRNDKAVCIAATRFLAALVNQQVAHELLALEVLTLLLQQPSDDSVEVAIEFMKEVGHTLSELSPQGVHGVFERLRGILHEGEIDRRCQFMIEGLFALRKSNFEGKQGVTPELDLVEEEDQVVHEVSLDDALNAEAALDVFREDPEYEENEAKWDAIKKEILGDDDEDEDDDDGEGSDESGEGESDEEGLPAGAQAVPSAPATTKIMDHTETNMVNLRREIYLTLVSSLNFEEAGHKLMKMKMPDGMEVELCTMIIECCANERTYLKYYGLLAQRFCFIELKYQQIFDELFMKQYALIHRLETNKLRNVAKLFAHLLATDALPWSLMAYVQLTEDATTSSSRIFVKLMFQELCEHMGLRKLNAKLQEPNQQEFFHGIFPKDSARNMRFAINFFTQIGLGGITDDLREALKELPKLQAAQQEAEEARKNAERGGKSDSGSSSYSGSESYSGSSSYSGSGSYSDSYSDTGSTPPRKKRKQSPAREPARERRA